MKERTVLALAAELSEGKTTSVALIDAYMKRIETLDGRLNSLADINHEARFTARALDMERSLKGPRSLLHGIPVILKDNILTKGAMRTTCNARVFKDFYAPYDATLVRKLKAAGAIILAKANLSEFAYFMSMGKMPSGFGSLHGQVVHPYDRQIDPLGSSTGSAVAVAADLAPITIGTETNGSLMSPARQNSVVAIKPTLGLVSRTGIVPISSLQDTAGPMSKTVKDAALMLDIIKGEDEEDVATAMMPRASRDFLQSTDKDVSSMRVGLLNFKNHPNDEAEKAILEEARKVLEKKGVTTTTLDIDYELIDNTRTLVYEFKRDMNRFLSSLTGLLPVTSLEALTAYNRADARRNLPYGQRHFHQAQATDARLKDRTYLEDRRLMMDAVETFKTQFTNHRLDAIITPKINGYAPVGGLPCVSVPAQPLKDRDPKSLLFIGLPFTEDRILPLAHTYETATKHRVPPNLEG